MKSSLIVYFPDLKRGHLNKDVGLAPIFIKKMFSYSDIKYAGLNKKLCDIPLPISKPGMKFINFFLLLFRLKNNDDLMVFHINLLTLFFVFSVAIFNIFTRKNIKVIIKADFNSSNIHLRGYFFLFLVNFISIFVSKFVVELDRHKNIFMAVVQHKVIVLPNAPFDFISVNKLKIKLSRKRCIIVIGRHGTKQKNSFETLDVLCDLLKENLNWSVKYLGDGSDSFKHRLEGLGEVQKRIEFVGNVQNRSDYLSHIRDSKVCIFGSLWEGVPLSAVEAALCGVTVVSPDRLIFAKEYQSKGFPFCSFPDNDFYISLRNSVLSAMSQDVDINPVVSYRKFIEEHYL